MPWVLELLVVWVSLDCVDIDVVLGIVLIVGLVIASVQLYCIVVLAWFGLELCRLPFWVCVHASDFVCVMALPICFLFNLRVRVWFWSSGILPSVC